MISKTSLGRPPYLVDTQATMPPLPPRMKQRGQQSNFGQTLLFVLMSLALSCIVIEACFIYRLYQSEAKREMSFSKQVGGEVTTPTKTPVHDVLPSKPVAHLTDGQDVVHGKHILSWSRIADPLLYEMSYREGNLVIHQEGYYYIYSKVFYLEKDSFYHYVMRHTERMAGANITLLQARKYSPRLCSTKSNSHAATRSNSYLAGVFHLLQNDSLYVNVSDSSHVLRHKSMENFFGAFMI
uniref:TNF superfamily member 14 n=1 Tax=Oryzias latipes TaxID=8090 RepID=A0A3P9LLW9_ORYLA